MQCIFCEVKKKFSNTVYFVFDLLRNRTAVILLPVRLCKVVVQWEITNSSAYSTHQHQQNSANLRLGKHRSRWSDLSHNPKNKTVTAIYAYRVYITKHSEQNVTSAQQENFLVLAASPCVKFYSAHTTVQVYINFTNSMVTYCISLSDDQVNPLSFLTQRLSSQLTADGAYCKFNTAHVLRSITVPLRSILNII